MLLELSHPSGAAWDQGKLSLELLASRVSITSKVSVALIRDHTSPTTLAGVRSRGTLLFREVEPKVSGKDLLLF